MKKYLVEFLGTGILVLFGCGVAVFTQVGTDNLAPTALAFGLTIIALAYVIGPISGCHINPAVSFAMYLSKKMTFKDMLNYMLAQILGAIVGAALLLLIRQTLHLPTAIFLGANDATIKGFASLDSVLLGLLVEVILTFVFVFTILGVTSKKENTAVSGIVIGLTLTFVHLFGIGLTGTSVNPARSIGPALIQALAGKSTLPLEQIYIFILAPLIGAAIAALLFKYLNNNATKSVENLPN